MGQDNQEYDKKWVVRIEVGIKEIVKRYNGTVDIDIEDGLFKIGLDSTHKQEVALEIADFMERIQNEIDNDKSEDIEQLDNPPNDVVWVNDFGWVV